MSIVKRLTHTFNADEDYYFTEEDVAELQLLQDKFTRFHLTLKSIYLHGGLVYDGEECAQYAKETLKLFLEDEA